MASPDLAIVGGGPVGLATAILARRAGLTARVFDKRRPPIDKACGEGVMPDGVRLLSSLGWTPAESECMPIDGIRYCDEEHSAEACFSGSPGLGIRRPVLHRGLVAAAERAGVELCWETRITGLCERGVETERGRVEAQWIVGADGLDSRVREWSGLAGRQSSHRRVGVRRHFGLPPWSSRVEVHWADGCEAYVTPVAPREVGVALLWSPERTGAGQGFEELLRRFPLLGERLAGAPRTSSTRGSGPLYRRARGFFSGRVALVGDAAGYLDAITGEGLALGFQQARSLVGALAAADLGRYAREAGRLAAFPFLLIRALLLVERRPWLRRRLIALLARDRELFTRLLSIHARELAPGALGAGGAARLLVGLLKAS